LTTLPIGAHIIKQAFRYPRIGNYEFVSILGEGGMGVVCKYRNATLNKFAAIKMLAHENVSEDMLMRFQREGQAAAKLEHPNIVGVHDLGVTEYGDPFMLLEFCEGQTLEELLRTNHVFTIRQVENIFLQCCDALEHAHSLGVLHRDIKPSNIMLNNLERDCPKVKVLDFGIAKILDHKGEFTTTTGTALGSPLYMSPEQALAMPNDPRTDIYSLGCVFYAVLNGNPPFMGLNSFETANLHQKEKPADLRTMEKLKEWPMRIKDTIMRMLEKEPGRRPQTMAEVRDLLSITEARVSFTISQLIAVSTAFLTLTVLCAVVAIPIIEKRAKEAALASMPPPPTIHAREGSEAETSPSKKANRQGILNPDEEIFSVEAATYKQVLNFNARDIHDVALKNLINDRNLRELYIAETKVTDEGMKILSNYQNLQQLDIQSTRVTSIGLKYLSKLQGLTALNLTGTFVDDQGMEYLNKMTTLRHLYLSRTQITDNGLSKLTALKNLETVNLNLVPITDEGLKILHYWPSLKVLSLDQTHITDSGLAYVSKYGHSLDNLSLEHCPAITESGLQNLRNLRVTALTLSVPSRNQSLLKGLTQLRHLTDLRIFGNLSAQGYKTIEALKSLKVLEFYGSGEIKGQDYQSLRTALSKCDIKVHKDTFNAYRADQDYAELKQQHHG
jgi:tRNA A-37 threonylcarbamoyl transferase component Bud32